MRGLMKKKGNEQRLRKSFFYGIDSLYSVIDHIWSTAKLVFTIGQSQMLTKTQNT